MIDKVKVHSDQNIVDLSLQEYGSIEGHVAFCKRNGLAVDADPVGSELEVETDEVVNTGVRTFYKNNNHVVATGKVNNIPFGGIFDETFDETFE
jgi:hypothetical protein